MPPASNALDREGCGVVGDTEIDPAGIGRDVVDPVRHHFAEFGDDEVMHPNRLRPAFRTQLSSAILEVFDKLLLLGVDRDRRQPGRPSPGH